MVKEELLKFDGTPLFPRAPGLHRQLHALGAGSRALRKRHRLRAEEMNRAERARWQAQGHGRLRADHAAAAARLQPGGHLPVAQAPPRPAGSAAARKMKLRARGRSVREEAELYVAKVIDLPVNLDEAEDELSRRGARSLRRAGRRSGHRRRNRRRAGSGNRHPARAGSAGPRRSRLAAATASGTSFRSILQDDPQMRDAAGRRRKLIIFTEHRDTLNYLQASIAGVLGNARGRRHASTAASTATSGASCRSCSARTRTSGCWSPPTPPAKASTSRAPT